MKKAAFQIHDATTTMLYCGFCEPNLAFIMKLWDLLEFVSLEFLPQKLSHGFLSILAKIVTILSSELKDNKIALDTPRPREKSYMPYECTVY